MGQFFYEKQTVVILKLKIFLRHAEFISASLKNNKFRSRYRMKP